MANSSKNRGTAVGNVIMVGALGWSVWAYYHPYAAPPTSAGGPGPVAMTVPAWPIFVLAVTFIVNGAFHYAAARSRLANQRGASSPILSPAPAIVVATSPVPMPALSERDRRVVELLPTSPDGRVYVEKLPQEIAASFVNQKYTSYQAEKLVADFLGKIVRWRLSVSELSRHGNSAVIQSYAPIDEHDDVLISMLFAAPNAANVLHLDKEEVIDIEGKIERVGGFGVGVRLTDCKLFASRRPTV